MVDSASSKILRPYVSNLDRPVFTLRNLPEEVIAVLFAYYSRSRQDLRTNLATLLREQWDTESRGIRREEGLAHARSKAQAFHEKWVVGYGHASVAEHAVVHLAIEGLSILATKIIEDARLASFTEKSTRYVQFGSSSFVRLPQLPSPLRQRYENTCRLLFDTYTRSFPVVQKFFEQRAASSGMQASRKMIHAQTCDTLRGLLPASTKTNVGITINARSLAGLLSKMLSSPILEFQQLAEQMRNEALEEVPTLLRHVGPNPFQQHARQLHENLTDAVRNESTPPEPIADEQVRLLWKDEDALERITYAMIADGLDAEFDIHRIETAWNEREKNWQVHWVDRLLENRGKHDPVPRAFEHARISVELMLDYGAYRDLQRHRMLTPSTRRLGCQLGASIPPEADMAGVGDEMRQALQTARETWEAIRSHDPWLAQYVVPLAFRTQTMWTLDLREAVHVVELRSSKQGHSSYRRVAQQLYRVLSEAYPWLAKHVRVDMNDYAWARQPDLPTSS